MLHRLISGPLNARRAQLTVRGASVFAPFGRKPSASGAWAELDCFFRYVFAAFGNQSLPLESAGHEPGQTRDPFNPFVILHNLHLIRNSLEQR